MCSPTTTRPQHKILCVSRNLSFSFVHRASDQPDTARDNQFGSICTWHNSKMWETHQRESCTLLSLRCEDFSTKDITEFPFEQNSFHLLDIRKVFSKAHCSSCFTASVSSSWKVFFPFGLRLRSNTIWSTWNQKFLQAYPCVVFYPCESWKTHLGQQFSHSAEDWIGIAQKFAWESWLTFAPGTGDGDVQVAGLDRVKPKKNLDLIGNRRNFIHSPGQGREEIIEALTLHCLFASR